MYVNALRIYENALKKEDKEGLGQQFNGGIYHNMGCAYMYLFQFKEASECFLKAYRAPWHTAGSEALPHSLLYGG